jgi:hypothetical protein
MNKALNRPEAENFKQVPRLSGFHFVREKPSFKARIKGDYYANAAAVYHFEPLNLADGLFFDGINEGGFQAIPKTTNLYLLPNLHKMSFISAVNV